MRTENEEMIATIISVGCMVAYLPLARLGTGSGFVLTGITIFGAVSQSASAASRSARRGGMDKTDYGMIAVWVCIALFQTARFGGLIT